MECECVRLWVEALGQGCRRSSWRGKESTWHNLGGVSNFTKLFYKSKILLMQSPIAFLSIFVMCKECNIMLNLNKPILLICFCT